MSVKEAASRLALVREIGVPFNLFKKAPGKLLKLYKIAKAALAKRKGMVEEMIFPVVPEDWLVGLVQEVESKKAFKENVRKALHRAYSSHYRQMLPNLLNSLVFHTTTQHQPIMQALEVVKAYLKRKGTQYPKGIQAPLAEIAKLAIGLSRK